MAILDTEREPSFDRLVQLATRQFQVPTALISLIDEEREWFKASCGFGRTELDRDLAFCTYTILDEEVMVVPDAHLDPRFRDNPLVTGEPYIRFYAGAPIHSAEGYKIGTICLVDSEPHPDFTEREKALLADLAAITSDQIQLRYAATDVLTEVETRMKVQDDLASAENWLSLFLRYSPVAVAMFDRDMRYLAASRQWRTLFELKGETIVGRCHFDVAPTLPSAWQEQNDLALAGLEPTVEEHWVSSSDGGYNWIRRQIRPWRDRDGEIGGLIVFAEIITERKQAEDALEGNRRFLDTVLQNVQDGIVACDENGHLSLFNGAARDFHGLDAEPLPPEEWSGRYDLFHGDGTTPLPADCVPLFRALQGEVVTGQEMVIAPKDRKARRLVAQATPLYDPDGRKIGAVASMHDVTREREAQERLQQAEARYRAIFENSFQFCGLIAPDGTLLETNQTTLDYLGKTREDVVGIPVWSPVWWGDDETISERMREAFERACAGEFIRDEIELLGANGRRMMIDFSLKAVRDDAGNVINLISEGRDISEKRRGEQELRRSEAELALILNNVPAWIVYKDETGRILRANASAARAFDRTPREIEGMLLADFIPEYAKKVRRDDMEIFAAGKPRLGVIEEFPARDGSTIWLRTDRVPHVDPETGERYMFVISSDITAEKQTEEALRASEERYRSLYNQTPVMLHSIDRDGRLLSVSNYWLERLGYEREEVIGRPSGEFLTPESARKAREEKLPEFLRTGACKDVEYQLLTKDGRTIDVLLSAVAEEGEGGSTRSMSVLVDVTEFKVLHGQLVQAQKMESVGQLTGGLAHDFNNLLGVVMGNLQLIERSFTGNPKMERRLQAALTGVERGAELTRRLLAFARRQKLEAETIAVNPLIEGMCDILRGTLPRLITLETRLAPNLPNVRTDVSQLESALLNLVVNARDAMPDGGRVMIESSTMTFSGGDAARQGEIAAGEYVEISVSDSGDGISPQNLERVFEPFFTTKDVGKGSGLGLSMIYGFIRQSGGQVRIYSEEGRGTCVRMMLPVDGASLSVRKPAVGGEGISLGRGETIMVVEDQDEVREVAVGMLEELGYHVLTARDGDHGLDLLEKASTVDLIFTDIVMPGGMDGPEFALRARQMRPELPVLFTTGYTEATVLHRSAIRSGSNLVTKPYRIADLAAKVRNTLDEVYALSGETPQVS
jgi:PAS domain S-box-containing protein